MKYQENLQNPYRGLAVAVVLWLVFSAYQVVKFAAGSYGASFGHLLVANVLPYAVMMAVIYGVYLLVLRSKSGKSFSELFAR
ncbi:MAG: hypothetical protein Q3972_05825 [Corynebacterium sp.]|nr:hypothetical protein [Corynebacterium sp.]